MVSDGKQCTIKQDQAMRAKNWARLIIVIMILNVGLIVFNIVTEIRKSRYPIEVYPDPEITSNSERPAI